MSGIGQQLDAPLPLGQSAAHRLAESLLPGQWWQRLKSAKRLLRLAAASSLRETVALFGYSISRRRDYYSPLPDLRRLKKTRGRWERPSELVGIDYDLSAFEASLAAMLERYGEEFYRLPSYRTVTRAGFGPGYTELDALLLYLMIRTWQPQRYVEVGSGLSTYYCSLAAKKNSAEGKPLSIHCIEPYPFPQLGTIEGITVTAKEVQDVELRVFSELDANDILFIDSTHVLNIDGDVPFLFLEVLPRLKPGVLVHIHDIAFPYNTPYPSALWVFGDPWPKFWNEAMLLQAFLCFNKQFQIILSTPLLRHFRESWLRAHIPHYQSVSEDPNTFSSIWLKRISA